MPEQIVSLRSKQYFYAGGKERSEEIITFTDVSTCLVREDTDQIIAAIEEHGIVRVYIGYEQSSDGSGSKRLDLCDGWRAGEYMCVRYEHTPIGENGHPRYGDFINLCYPMSETDEQVFDTRQEMLEWAQQVISRMEPLNG